jgi:hypothetical protein
MRSITVHDLIAATIASSFFTICTIALQIIVITQSTIPADEVIKEIRIMRTEQINQTASIEKRLNEIEAAVINDKVRRTTLETLGIGHGNSTN